MEDSLQKIWRDMVCLSRPYPFRFFKGCLPQNSLSLLLNTLSHVSQQMHSHSVMLNKTSMGLANVCGGNKWIYERNVAQCFLKNLNNCNTFWSVF